VHWLTNEPIKVSVTPSEPKTGVKKAKAELFNAQNLALGAKLKRDRLFNETAKAYRLAGEAARALSEAKDQWASILERAL
jgi:hypothetical protein